jgi:hypothetical protein
MSRHDAEWLVCRIQPIPREAALEALPLYQAMAYSEAHYALLRELLCATDSRCLSYEVDGGLSSLLALRNLASQTLDEALQRGDLKRLW